MIQVQVPKQAIENLRLNLVLEGNFHHTSLLVVGGCTYPLAHHCTALVSAEEVVHRKSLVTREELHIEEDSKKKTEEVVE